MIDVAYAQTGGAAAGNPMAFFWQFFPLLLVFVVFYFLLIRPQSKRQKALREMIKSLKKGDRVVTSGGLHGEVFDVKDDTATLVLKVADNVKMVFTKQSVVSVESKKKE